MLSMPSLRSCDAPVRNLALVNLLMQSGHQAAYFVGLIGTATYVLEANAFGIAVMVAVINLCYTVGSAMVGVAVDRFGPHAVLVRLLAAYAALTLAAPVVPLSYATLVVLAGGMALLAGCGSTTISAFPPYLVRGKEALKQANSLADTAVHVAIIIGPAAGGAISGALSSTAVFLFSAGTIGAATLVALRLQERFAPEHKTRGNREEGTSAWRDFADGVRVTFASPNLRFLFAVGFLGFFAYGAFDALESLFYRDVLSVGVQWMGYLSMASGIGAVMGSALLLRIPPKRTNTRLLVATLLLTGVGSMVYTGTSILPVAFVGQALTGLGFGLMMPVQHLLVQESCELSHMGRVAGVMRVGLNSSGVLPLMVSPFLAQAIGVQAVLFGASTLVAVIALGFAARLRLAARG